MRRGEERVMVPAVLDWRTNAREMAARREPARGWPKRATQREGRPVGCGGGGAHGCTGWMGAGTVFKRKEKERGESSEWLVHY